MSESIDTPTVLLVSGSSPILRSIDRLLPDSFEVLNAVDGAKAWEMLQETESISLLICSLEIAIDQQGLLERVRQARDSRIAALPVLLLVGESDSEEACQQAFSLGASDYIKMPFSAEELQTRARLQLRMFHQQGQLQEQDVGSDPQAVDLLNTQQQQEIFVSRVNKELSFCLRHRAYLSVVLLSVVNEDAFEDGHERSVLSALLRTLTQQLKGLIRREDSLAYVGDATFALLFPVTNGLGAKIAIDRIMQALSALNLKSNGGEISLSQNAALYSKVPDESLSSDDVMTALHQRLATARQKGAGQVVSSRHEIEDTRLSLDQAVNKIRYKQTENLAASLPDLLDRVKPLLQFARQHDAPELQDIVDEISD